MRDRLLKQTSREYGPMPRLALLAAAGVLFVIILPLAILRLGGRLDRLLGWPALVYPPVNAIAGGLMVLAGWPFALWAIYVQYTLGRGTPVPVTPAPAPIGTAAGAGVATQELIVRPPYSYCRNPMAPGMIIAYLGLSVTPALAPKRSAGASVAGSLGAALMVAPGAAALLIYIKIAEEQEMVARFGEEYLAYRSQVPFIIPRLRRRG
jgi:protein-S-isoprenylcysteine O-methyltransferase Ste14